MNVLVIDDDAAVAEILKRQLIAEGYEVEVASNGVEAWERLQEHRFETVIADLIMPEMNGLELIDRIKAVYPETGVIAISGEGRSIDKESPNLTAASRHGAHFTFCKPLDIDNLKTALKVLA